MTPPIRPLRGFHFSLSRLVADYDCISGHARHFPTLISRTPKQDRAFGRQARLPSLAEAQVGTANVSPQASLYLGIPNKSGVSSDLSESLWMHVLAIGYAPDYLRENAEAVGDDWPKIPLPASHELLATSARLGRRIAALLDVEKAVDGVTIGEIQPELRLMALRSHEGGKPLYSEAGDYKLAAGWGHRGKAAAVMPGKGKIRRRDYTPAEIASLEEGAQAQGVTLQQITRYLGETSNDIYLNAVAYWRNVPSSVWEYAIGGHQVIKKWLSYRERELLGRPLKMDEVKYVTEMVRRIAGILLLKPKLDANYQAVKENTYTWPSKTIEQHTLSAE